MKVKCRCVCVCVFVWCVKRKHTSILTPSCVIQVISLTPPLPPSLQALPPSGSAPLRGGEGRCDWFHGKERRPELPGERCRRLRPRGVFTRVWGWKRPAVTLCAYSHTVHVERGRGRQGRRRRQRWHRRQQQQQQLGIWHAWQRDESPQDLSRTHTNTHKHLASAHKSLSYPTSANKQVAKV